MAALENKLRRLNAATHRDLGYFFFSLVVVYCLSGLALNHVDDWNPDFSMVRHVVPIDASMRAADATPESIRQFGTLVGESEPQYYDSPTPNQLKIYYHNATLHLNFDAHEGRYERLERRPILFQSNLLHRNSVRSWKWLSDVFAVMLIAICMTGLFVLRGKNGIAGRGKWLVLAGAAPPLVALVVFYVS